MLVALGLLNDGPMWLTKVLRKTMWPDEPSQSVGRSDRCCYTSVPNGTSVGHPKKG